MREKGSVRTLNNQNIQSLWKDFILILLLSGLFGSYLVFQPGDSKLVTLADNLTQGILEGVGLFLTFPLFWWRTGQMKWPFFLRDTVSPKTSQRWVPLLLGLGILSYIIGQFLWTYNEDIAHLAVLFPSWADAGYLGSYPFVLLAILLLPSQQIPAESRVRVALDGLMIMVGAVTFSWYFILGPTILQGADTVAGQIIGTAYPLATLMLILCLLLLMARTDDSKILPVVLILALALTVVVITDTIYDYQELHNQYNTGTLLDLGWPLGYMLVGLSARAMRLSVMANPRSTSPPSALEPSPQITNDTSLPRLLLWRSLIPYLLVPAVIILLAFIQYSGQKDILASGVYLGIVVLMGLLLVRQIFAIRGTIARNKQLWMMQQEVQKKNEALNHVNVRLESAYKQQYHLNTLKDQFITNVTHELRTPLTLVYGYLELLGNEDERVDGVIQTKFLQNAKGGCEELILLVNNILDAIHISQEASSPQLGKISLSQVVQEVCEHFSQSKELEDRLNVEIPASLYVQANQQYLRQVIRNLLSNALKYSPANTPITISAQLTEQREPPQVSLCVQDAGPGIPLQEQPLLFQKFVRLERDLSGPIRGTGLGLYISKQLVESMNGKVWVESSGREGEGSRFYITLLAVSPVPHDKRLAT